MPMVEVSLPDLERLVGIKLSEKDIVNSLEMMKGEIEELTEDALVFEASHDRPDLFSAEGLGRAISYIMEVRKPRKYRVAPPTTFLDISQAPKYRPYAYLAIVRNVELDDEGVKQLFQLQEKLHSAYCGDRSLVSIGLYDLDKIVPPIRYLEVEESTFIPLGESKEMTLKEILEHTDKGFRYKHLVKEGGYPLLTDSRGEVLSFPPIINSEMNKVTEETRNILIDVTGTEPNLMMKVLNVVTTSVAERGNNVIIEAVEIRGGEAPHNVAPDLEGEEVSVAHDSIQKLLGYSLNRVSVQNILQKMGYVARVEDDFYEVWIPPYRIDVHGEVDVVEDIAIGYGYSNIPLSRTPPSPTLGFNHPIERFSSLLRDFMVGMGLQEVLNFMLIDEDVLNMFSGGKHVKLVNPKMKQYSALRNSIIPSLLISAVINYEKVSTLEIFEVGDVVQLDNGVPTTERMVGFLLMGDKYTLTDGLVIAKTLTQALGGTYRAEGAEIPGFIKGRTAKIYVNDIAVGHVGELDPALTTELGVMKPVIAGEISLNLLRKVLLGFSSQ